MSAVDSVQQPQEINNFTEDGLMIPNENLSLVQRIEQYPFSLNHRLGAADAPQASQGFALQKTQQSDAADLQVERDQSIPTWSCQVSTQVAPVLHQWTTYEPTVPLPPATLPAVAAGARSDFEPIVAAPKLAASIGISKTGSMVSEWQLQTSIPKQQEASDFKYLDDNMKTSVKNLDCVSSHLAVLDRPEQPGNLTDNTQKSLPYPKEEFSSLENVGKDTCSPQQNTRDAETLPLQPSWSLATQKAELCDAPVPQPNKTWTSCRQFSPVVLVMHQQTDKQRNIPLPQTAQPLVSVGLSADSRAAVTPVSHAASAGFNLAVARLNEVQMPLSTPPVHGPQQQQPASAFCSLPSSLAPRGDRLFTLTKMPPAPNLKLVSLPVSQATPPETSYSDKTDWTVKNEQNGKDETQLVRSESTEDSNNYQKCTEKEELNQRKKLSTCADCGKIFASPYSLKKHVRTHTGERRYLCAQCGKMFTQERNLRYHMSLHSGSREFAVTCPECGKTFSNRNYLSSHLKIHRNQREYACPVCGRRFNQRVAYSTHVRIHSGYRPHRCSVCDKAFSRKVLLRHHMRTHTGEKPFACQVCDKQFSDRSNMLVHARSHWGIKPYSCDHCGRSFTQRSNLRSHVLIHLPKSEPATIQSSAGTPDTTTSQEQTSYPQELRTTSVIFKTGMNKLNNSPSPVDSQEIT